MSGVGGVGQGAGGAAGVQGVAGVQAGGEASALGAADDPLHNLPTQRRVSTGWQDGFNAAVLNAQLDATLAASAPPPTPAEIRADFRALVTGDYLDRETPSQRTARANLDGAIATLEGSDTAKNRLEVGKARAAFDASLQEVLATPAELVAAFRAGITADYLDAETPAQRSARAKLDGALQALEGRDDRETRADVARAQREYHAARGERPQTPAEMTADYNRTVAFLDLDKESPTERTARADWASALERLTDNDCRETRADAAAARAKYEGLFE